MISRNLTVNEVLLECEEHHPGVLGSMGPVIEIGPLFPLADGMVRNPVLFTQLLQSQAILLAELSSLSGYQFCIDVHGRCPRSEI